MVTHDARAAAIADRILFLADGRIVRDLGPSSAHDVLAGDGGGERAMIARRAQGPRAAASSARRSPRSRSSSASRWSAAPTSSPTRSTRRSRDLFTESYAGTDAVVTGKAADQLPGRAGDAAVPEALLDRSSRRSRGRGRGRNLSSTSRRSYRQGGQGDRAGARTFGFGVDIESRARPLQPAAAARGPLAVGPERGRHRRRDRRQARAIRSATGSGSRPSAPSREFEIVGLARYGERRLARQRDLRRLRRPDGPGAVRKERRVRRYLRRGARMASRPSSSCAISRPSCRRSVDVQTGEGVGRRRRRARSTQFTIIQLLPARLRRHRALRRRVRHLQHALDHGRAAHARVRDAADDRRLPPPGPRLGRARVARDRLLAAAHRPLRSGSGSPRA